MGFRFSNFQLQHSLKQFASFRLAPKDTSSVCMETAGPVPGKSINDFGLDIESSFQKDPTQLLVVASCFRNSQRLIEFRIQGPSMGRTIPDGSTIKIKIGSHQQYRVGEVVAFFSGNWITVHRVAYRGRYSRARNYLMTQGDAQWVPDLPVNVKFVLGTVIEVQTEDGWKPVADRPIQHPIRRFLSFVLCWIIGCSMEGNLRLAQWLVIALRKTWAAALLQNLVRIRNIPNAAWKFILGLCSEAATMDERTRLTAWLYDKHPQQLSSGLVPWEKSWFERRLPKPPARILLGGCGAGREALALVDAGYQVDAFDPAPGHASSARQALRSKGCVWTFGYEDLAAAVLGGTQRVTSEVAKRRYDAIILGWGSLTHVVSPQKRVGLFQALDSICHNGPILASFWCTTGHTPPVDLPGRAQRYGHVIGRQVALLRGIRAETNFRLSFAIHRGFGHTFVPEEIETLGTEIKRKIVWEQDATTYAHVTFLPS